MEGFDAPYIPGWDCHGLPIEHQVEKKLGSKRREITQKEFRNLCREYAKDATSCIVQKMREMRPICCICSGSTDHLAAVCVLVGATQ